MDNVLSKQEVIWFEIMEMEVRLKGLVSMLNQSEKNVGNTVTSIEKSLEVIHKQLKDLSDTTNSVAASVEQAAKMFSAVANEAVVQRPRQH